MKLYINAQETDVLVEEAVSFGMRLRGLLGKTQLPMTYAMRFLNCNSIHTFFMGTDIDVVMMDKASRVTSLAAKLKPWKLLADSKAAHTLELCPGAISRLDIKKNDLIEIK